MNYPEVLYYSDAARGKTRCYEALMQISNFTTMYLHAMATLPGAVPPKGPGISSGSKALDGVLAIPIFDVQTSLFSSTTPDSVAYEAYERPPKPTERTGVTTASNHGDINLLISGAIFGSYYEKVSDWVKNHFSKDVIKWPEMLNFARYVRNAVFHGETIEIRSMSASKYSWRGIDIGPSDNGNRIWDYISKADLVLLMLDLEAELDNIRAPNPLP